MGRWAIAASIIVVIVGTGAVQGDSRIGFVNSDIVLQQTPGYATADSTLAADRQNFRDEVLSLEQQMDSAGRAFDQQQAMLSPAAREAKVQELQEMSQRFQLHRTRAGASLFHLLSAFLPFLASLAIPRFSAFFRPIRA